MGQYKQPALPNLDETDRRANARRRHTPTGFGRQQTVGETGKLDRSAAMHSCMTPSDFAKVEARQIKYTGPGVYSLRGCVYVKGERSTGSRIKML